MHPLCSINTKHIDTCTLLLEQKPVVLYGTVIEEDVACTDILLYSVRCAACQPEAKHAAHNKKDNIDPYGSRLNNKRRKTSTYMGGRSTKP